MTCSSPVILVCFFATLLQGTVRALVSCEPEGNIQLAVNDTIHTYHLLQVCLFGHWSYVCGTKFGNADRNVALYQLGCTQGATKNLNVNSSWPLPVYLTNINCLGVERRLIDCRRAQLKNIITGCDTRVGAYCDEYGNFTCQNGELQIRNNTTNALYICINGGWRTLCYNEYLWGPTQATVACRELNPGKMVTTARVTGFNGITTSTTLIGYFQCTGDEAHLTDYVIGNVNSNICGNKGVELMCETVSTVMLTSTQTGTFTPSISCSLFMSTTLASETPSCSITTVVSTPSCTAQRVGTQFLGASPVNTTPSSSPLPWVGGGIIGVVLSSAILLTVLAAVCLLRRRRRTHSQHKMSNNVLDGSASPVLINHSNELYCDSPMQAKQWPQPYEEVQLKEPESEYSYATHGVDVNTYDSMALPVPHDENGGCDGSTKEQVHVVDNTALYSLCEDISENEMYSKLDRK